MTEKEKMIESQTINLSNEFFELLKLNVIFTIKHSVDKLYYNNMSANVIIHHWNHSHFLSMLFESFYEMDRENIDIEFIITDGGSDKTHIDIILNLMKRYENKLKIIFLYHNLDDIRKNFNETYEESTFHSFPYISNSALNFCEKDIHVLCDSSNIVDNLWIRGLLSPHYIFHKSDLIVKSKGGDFSADSTLFLENKDFNSEWFELEHTFNNFGGGNGVGWSIKMSIIKEMLFNQFFSCVGGVDDEFWYRAKIFKNIQFLGHEKSKAVHRIHYAGYEKNKRKPNWAYKQLLNYYNNNEFKLNYSQNFITPDFVERNF